MVTQVICPTCSTKLQAKVDAVGKKIRCPKCQAAISVPATNTGSETVEQSASAASLSLLVLGAIVLIAVAVGVAGGFVLGHQQGKTHSARILAEEVGRAEQSAAHAEAATRARRALEADLAEQEKERRRLEAVVKERDQQLASSSEAILQAKSQAKIAEDRLEAFVNSQRDAENTKQTEPEKKRIPAVPLTEERKRKSEADAEYVNKNLRSANRSILKGMTILFGFNSLCEEDNVTKESIARVVGDDRDLLFTAGQMLVDVGSYIRPMSKKGLMLKESWDICMDVLGVRK